MQLIGEIPEQLEGTIVNVVQASSMKFSKAFKSLQPSLGVDKMRAYGLITSIIALSHILLTSHRGSVKHSRHISQLWHKKAPSSMAHLF